MSREIPIYQIDAFAEGDFRGNPAAVCPLEQWLPDTLLQMIAEENNLSETAFYVPEGEGFRIRWFTPTVEVDLCGHATLSAARVVFERGEVEGDTLLFHSRSGPLLVKREGGRLRLDFPAQPGKATEVPELLAHGLGGWPVECYRSADFLAVFSSEEEVYALEPDFKTLAQLPGRGVIVTAKGADVDFVSRFFAPSHGIEEDAVTGSAHCTLAPYWAKRLGKTELTAWQISRRGGVLECRVEGDRVLISGKTRLFLKGSIWVD
ncbi:MAG: PhzF family phenazine biosynthesis protein [Puniceicoccales bacterium]